MPNRCTQETGHCRARRKRTAQVVHGARLHMDAGFLEPACHAGYEQYGWHPIRPNLGRTDVQGLNNWQLIAHKPTYRRRALHRAGAITGHMGKKGAGW